MSTPTRRTFLVSAAALASACDASGTLQIDPRTLPEDPDAPPETTGGTTDVAPESEPEPEPEPQIPGPEPAEPWDPPGVLDLRTFGFGIQIGDVTDTAALISVRQHDEAELTLVLARGVDEGWREVRRMDGLLPLDAVLQLEVVDLVPDTTYSVVAYAADGERRGTAARFRTALWPETSRLVRFGATSCLGRLGAPWRSLSAVAREKLDFFVLLGDTIYADEGLLPTTDREGRWEEALKTAGLRDLFASTSIVATWDDHEVSNDWSWDDIGMPADGFSAFSAFRRAIPLRSGPGGSGVWRKLSWGQAVDVFVLDCRGERMDGNYVSPEQLSWLEDQLLASTARFKIVVNSVPITDMDQVYLGIAADDRWDGYPLQRREILDWIEENRIGGVLWIAGDFHWGAISRIGRPGEPHHGMTEVFCGPGGSFVNPLALFASPQQFPVVIDRWNAVIFEADPDAGTIRVVFRGDDEILSDITLAL